MVSHLSSPPSPKGRLLRLPPSLLTRTCLTTAGYSKVSRGLHVPLGVCGLHTTIACSEASGRGQWGPRYAIHASRHLNGKVLRYLKRVIVTPAVYPLLAPLKGGLKYGHWADFTNRTHPFELAVGYVFVKQSGPPSHCALHPHS